MIVVYTPRNQSGVKKLETTEVYKCQAYIDQEEKRKNEMDKLINEINRRNTENYNLN